MNISKLLSFVLIAGLCGFGHGLRAQELGLHFMSNVWQSNLTNPALAPNQKIIFSFPGVATNFSHSAVSFNEVITTNAEGQKQIDSRRLLAELREQNFLSASARVESFHLAVSVLNMQFSLHHAVRFNGLLRYPRSLAQLALEGNAGLIGQEVDIAPGFDLMAYNEIGVGFNIRLAGLWLGGRIKALNGLGILRSDPRSSIRLRTDEEIYQLQLKSDYRVNSAGFFDVGIDGSEWTGDFSADGYGAGDFFRMNRGWAIDLGGRYRVNDKLSIAASIIDLGYISWQENVNNFESQGAFSFDGLALDDLVSDNSIELGSSTDTLVETLNFSETENGFTTLLASKIYLSGSYRFHRLFRAGALWYLDNQPGKTFSALALSGTLELGNIFSFGAVYSIHNRSFGNLGLNVQAKLGPVQFFALSDNVLAATRPANSRGTNFRLGLNMAFGKRGIQPPLVGRKD